MAAAAGVSKGGLLHHFSNKQDLLESLISELVVQFEAKLAEIKAQDAVETGRTTRAILRATQVCQDDSAAGLWAAFLLAGRSSSSFAERSKEFFYNTMKDDQADGPDQVALAIVYLAADGLALADLGGVFDENPELRQRIQEQLERITHEPRKLP